jgi:hypothetical protein
MKTHVDNVHPHLLAKKKFVLNEKVMVKLFEIDHNQQHGKKKVGAISFAITSLFGSTNPYKNVDEAQQKFIEDLVLYICKGYKPLSTCENMLKWLILHQCLRVVFLSHFSLVK